MAEPGERRLLVIGRTWDGEAVGPGERVVVELTGTPEHLVLRVEAPFHGDPPPAPPPGVTPRLWEHEVVELFVAGAGEPVPYLEIELGPHGHHLVLRLEGVRRTVEEGLAIDYRAAFEAGRWRGEARVPRSLLPPPPHRVNAFAIHGGPARPAASAASGIPAAAGAPAAAAPGHPRRHLAMEPLPGPNVDFHQPERFPPMVLP